MHCSNHQFYSITSSAVASNDGGNSSPNSLAVLRLIASSKLIGACAGSSAGFAPLNAVDIVRRTSEDIEHHVRRSRSAFASFRSEAPNPSVNQL
jgi:hypothetical protein